MSTYIWSYNPLTKWDEPPSMANLGPVPFYPTTYPWVKTHNIPTIENLAGPKRRTQNARSGTRVPNAEELIVAFTPSEPCRSFFAPWKIRYITKMFLTISWWLHPPFEPVGALNPFFWAKERFQTQPHLRKKSHLKPSETRLESAQLKWDPMSHILGGLSHIWMVGQ